VGSSKQEYGSKKELDKKDMNFKEESNRDIALVGVESKKNDSGKAPSPQQTKLKQQDSSQTTLK
jgi:hypothetical protein